MNTWHGLHFTICERPTDLEWYVGEARHALDAIERMYRPDYD